MKLHLSLATHDLAAGIAFYTTLFGVDPSKAFDDYALFLVDDPGLELALDHDPRARAVAGQHFGIVVDSATAVDRQIERLQTAGYAVEIERNETCCYANQTKVWARDPDGRRWETYVVHTESDARDGDRSCYS